MITSRKNPRLQMLHSLLQDRKTREDHGLFVIEGVRLLEEAVSNQTHITEAFFAGNLSERGKHIIANMQENSIPVEEVDESVFLNLMDTSNSQGIAAVCRIPEPHFTQKLDFVILADQLKDPGNMGTLMRTAAAAGAQAVLTTPGSVDLYSPKVIRSAMGAHFHLTCVEMDWEGINQLLHENELIPFTVFTAVADGEKRFWDCDFTRPTVLVIGSEAEGASKQALELTDRTISIPMPGNFESLNAAVAAGIIIFEIVKQRSKRK